MDKKRPPSVDALARSVAELGLAHPLAVDAAREAIAAGDPKSAAARGLAIQRRMLSPVINGTGVLLHTNLGRAPVVYASTGDYQNLELDLETGERGDRQAVVGGLIARAVGAEAAMVVNNCAAAMLLVLVALGAGRDVVVSRSELVEIGGGFRVPEVMAASGVHLVRVGTTNRTRVGDFAEAIAGGAVAGSDVALVVRIHQSNYRIVGFTEAPGIGELAGLGVPLVADIGSGLVDARCGWLDGPPPAWLSGEPAARQTLEAGAGLVTFSGDKLFGGPQAGIIAGRADLVAQCAGHQLARALRPGGLVLGALQQTALAYLRGDGAAIEFWRMAALSVGDLQERLGTYERLGLRAISTASVPGGGTLPGVEIDSVGIVLSGDRTSALRGQTGPAAAEPAAVRPIIARVHEGNTIVDLRTIHPDDDGEVATALSAV